MRGKYGSGRSCSLEAKSLLLTLVEARIANSTPVNVISKGLGIDVSPKEIFHLALRGEKKRRPLKMNFLTLVML